jgi:predicted PurR-regulated permease PerM
METRRIEISYKTIIFIVGFLLGLWFVFEIRDILSFVFLSLIVAAGLRAPVEWLEDRLKLPRMFAILIAYIVFICVLFILLYVMIPALVQQTIRLIQQLEYFFSISNLAPYINGSVDRITDQLTGITANIFRATLGAFSIVINFFTMLVLTFYLLLERRHMRVFLKNILGEDMKERVVNMILQIERRLGDWVRGELLLIIIIGVMSYIGLTLLNIEYALPLAILAGLLEIVPVVGPIISAIPAIIIALLVSPWLAVAVGALYFLIQQLENHLIVPMVMRQTVGIPPVVTILAIMIGGKLGGVGGALLSIPLFICLQIIFQEFVTSREEPKVEG